jgi:hypothetical protein
MLAKQVTLNLLYLLLVSTAQASFVNVSIDDTYGDAITGQKPVYQPSGPWDGANCTHCDIVPSVALAFDGTWTAATYNPGKSNINITLSFTGQEKKTDFCFNDSRCLIGVSIWVFFILANLNTFGYGLATNCNFTLDGNFMSSFNSKPNLTTHNLDYNVTAFSIGGLSNTQHTLVISANDYPNSTFINFDYAIYTYVYPVIALPTYCSKLNLGCMIPVTQPRRIQDFHPLVSLVESLAPVAPHLQKKMMIHPLAVAGRESSLDLWSEASRSESLGQSRY